MLLQYWQSLYGAAKTNHHKINTLTPKRKLMPDTITKNMIIVMKDTITAMKDMIMKATTMNMKAMITTTKATTMNTLVTIMKAKKQNTVTRSFSRKPRQQKPLSKYGKFNLLLSTK